ncbi:probable cytochrome P450 6a14 [Acyrthosiphon pisum]|uniref:Uncharacterized protein n=1 Tax=Acyrthosiphon pisum TaxID=7029 RepID=A0A8R2NP67_ACYPI|nr:probable cytochrome P450 6a14 [Acyrthosiphon pisum]
MFFAGFEPVSSTLSFCLYQLALNQHNQEEMRDEMNSKVKEHGKINNDFLVDLHYSDMVLAGEYCDLRLNVRPAMAETYGCPIRNSAKTKYTC